jgi:hypothetical protein
LRPLTVAVVALALLVAVDAGAARRLGGEPDCRASTEPGRESHRWIFKARCDFEINRLVADPSSPVFGVWNRTRIAGDRDPGDTIRCRPGPKRRNVRCHGVAGASAKVIGRYETKDLNFDCDVRTRFHIFGGIDCEPGDGCAEIAFAVRIPPKPPLGCG